MARDSKEQKGIKIKALHEALKELETESTPTCNLVTFDKVVSRANELCSDQLDSKISPTSVKTPTSKEFKVIKDVIEKIRIEHSKQKKVVPKTTIKEVANLKQQIKEIMADVVKFYDYKLLLNEKLEVKDDMINRLKAERDKLYEEINRLRDV